MPRPTRLLRRRGCAGLSDDRFSSSAILDLHQVADLSKHACDGGALVVLDGAADLAEAERSERAPVGLALPDLATNLRYPNLRHLASPAPQNFPTDCCERLPAARLPPVLCTGAPPRSSCRGSSRRPPAGAGCADRRPSPSPC